MIYGGVSKHFIKSYIFIILPRPFPHHTFLTVPAHPPVLWEDVEFVNIFYKQIVAANLFLLHFLSAAPPFPAPPPPLWQMQFSCRLPYKLYFSQDDADEDGDTFLLQCKCKSISRVVMALGQTLKMHQE